MNDFSGEARRATGDKLALVGELSSKSEGIVTALIGELSCKLEGDVVVPKRGLPCKHGEAGLSLVKEFSRKFNELVVGFEGGLSWKFVWTIAEGRHSEARTLRTGDVDGLGRVGGAATLRIFAATPCGAGITGAPLSFRENCK